MRGTMHNGAHGSTPFFQILFLPSPRTPKPPPRLKLNIGRATEQVGQGLGHSKATLPKLKDRLPSRQGIGMPLQGAIPLRNPARVSPEPCRNVRQNPPESIPSLLSKLLLKVPLSLLPCTVTRFATRFALCIDRCRKPQGGRGSRRLGLSVSG